MYTADNRLARDQRDQRDQGLEEVANGQPEAEGRILPFSFPFRFWVFGSQDFGLLIRMVDLCVVSNRVTCLRLSLWGREGALSVLVDANNINQRWHTHVWESVRCVRGNTAPLCAFLLGVL